VLVSTVVPDHITVSVITEVKVETSVEVERIVAVPGKCWKTVLGFAATRELQNPEASDPCWFNARLTGSCGEHA
jgi:hypothetical protein